MSATKIAQTLLINRETVCNHFKRYRKGGLAALQRNDTGGSDAALQGFLKTLAGHHRLHKCFRNELHAMLRDKAHSEIVNEVVLP